MGPEDQLAKAVMAMHLVLCQIATSLDALAKAARYQYPDAFKNERPPVPPAQANRS